MNALLLMGLIAVLAIVCLIIVSLWEQDLKQLHEEIAWLELSLEEALKNKGQTIEMAQYYKQGMEEVLEHNVKLLKSINKRGGINR